MSRGNLVCFYALTNRLEEAKLAYQQAIARKVGTKVLHDARFAVAFVERDAAEMDRQSSWAADKPGTEDLLLAHQADVEAFSGHLVGRTATSRDARSNPPDVQTRAKMRGAEPNERGSAGGENSEIMSSRFTSQTASALAKSSTTGIRVLSALALARV